MSDPEIRTRTRRKHHKVATGCANCKRRRVKCDETENGCLRCQKANLFCPGYNPPRARIFESASRSETSVSDSEVTSIVQSQNSTPFPVTSERGIDLRLVWQTALLDSFLTTWLPGSLVRNYTNGREADAMVPMSAWPLVTWKLAKRKDESFVAHALLCLTLCVIGSQTGDIRLVAEAAQHYARVLGQFRAQVSLLTRSGYSAKQDEHVASLAAAGFCCSQVEYILQSWNNGDRHLQGMASLLQACGPACLRHDDTRSIFYDHYLLWTSCAVTHRQPSIYSQAPWPETDWLDLPSSCKSLISMATCIPPLLQEYDTLREKEASPESSEMYDLLNRLAEVAFDIEALGQTRNFITHSYNNDDQSHDFCNPAIPCEVNDDTFLAVVMTAYSSGFVLHAGIAMWEILRSQPEGSRLMEHLRPYGLPLTEESLREGCDRHLMQICRSIDELAHDRFGMITSSPLLFLLDSAWLGYKALQDFCDFDIDQVRPWFAKIGRFVSGTGYRPLREPWLVADIDPTLAGLMSSHDLRSRSV